MLSKPVLGQTDNKITAADLTSLMLYYQDIWNTPSGSFTFATHNDASTLDRRFGWGQGGVALVDSNDQIRTLSKNDLIFFLRIRLLPPLAGIIASLLI